MNQPALIRILVLLCLLFLPAAAAGGTITGYTTDFTSWVDADGTKQLAIRSFSADGVAHKLLVNPLTLRTSAVPAQSLRPAASLPDNRLSAYLAVTRPDPSTFQNHGLTRAAAAVPGMFLTVDLCPSQRPFEQGMFETLGAMADRTGQPVPVAICITGAWLKNHPAELAWLKEQDRRGRLAITWVNHSRTHFYNPALPLARNFMLADGTDQRREILDNEIAMLQAGITPAPFFRYPGLVSDIALDRLLASLHLIPLGADAWLAKGEQPADGSIILVHGNGNEPPGIAKLMKLLQAPKPPRFLPLADAIPAADNKTLDKPTRTGQR